MVRKKLSGNGDQVRIKVKYSIQKWYVNKEKKKQNIIQFVQQHKSKCYSAKEGLFYIINYIP